MTTRTGILSAVGIAALATIFGATSYVLRGAHAPIAGAPAPQASSTADTPGVTPAAFVSPTPPQGWKEYNNATYDFSLFYPDDLSLADHDEPAGEHTAVFDDPEGNKGFQVFIVPYSGTQITQDRFLLDDPSGVMQDPTDVMVDGVRGTIFFSSNAIMGDTRELWFIRGGYLYEVTTYKPLDTWLADIMKTWQFLN
jgi:hypothetical protein